MQIVTDRAADLTPEQLENLNIVYAPLTLTLDGKSYVSGVDIQHNDFYELLESSSGMPATTLPSPGEFAEIYRTLGKKDPDILSIHISSGLSGTYNAAKQGAALVEGANITVLDSMTLSGAEGWQVEAAARAAKSGWPLDKIIDLVDQVKEVTSTCFTLPDLKYLIHGGRISHLKGLLAQALNLKPIIGVDKDTGKYAQWGRARTFSRAVEAIIDVIASQHPEGTAMRIQVMHARAPQAADKLSTLLNSSFKCEYLPVGDIAPVLGAHTGPGLVGLVYAPLKMYPQIP